MVAVKIRERLCELVRQESHFNPCLRLDARMYPGLDLELGYSLDDKYSVTQSAPGDYFYVKWWDSGTIPRFELSWKMKVEALTGT